MTERVVKVRLSAAVSDYKASMLDAAQATRAVGTDAQKLTRMKADFDMLGRAGLAVGGSMTALSLAVAKTGVEYNALQQRSRAALETLLGSAEAANAQMDKLDEFARTSPFSKSVFIEAQQQMLAFGIETEKVIPYLDAMQDAVAAAGGTNADLAGIVATMSKIQSSSKITATDLIEFGNRGIDAAGLIGAAMGKTGAQIREEITAGSLDAEDALDALAEGMSEKFDGAAENVKDTWDGAVDRIGAAWRDLAADLSTPLVDPEGGGALVDLVNLGADILRTFEALPDPVKHVTGGLFAFAGAVATVTSATLLAYPKIVQYKLAMQDMNLNMGRIARTGAIAGGALTGLVAIIGAVASAQEAQRQKAESYADAIDQGADAVRELAEANLQAEKTLAVLNFGSAYDNADKLGISLRLVEDAVTDGGEALDELSKILDTATGGGEAAQEMADELGISYLELTQTAGTLTEQVNDEREAQERANVIRDQASRATDENTESTESAAGAYLEAASGAGDLRDELDQLIATINEANGVGQDAITANLNYKDALADVDEYVQNARDGVDGYTATLDENTQEGRDNMGMLLDIASSAQEAADAQFALDGDTDAYRQTLLDSRQALIDRARDLGANKEEAEALADQIFRIPDDTEWEVIAETQAASTALENFVNRWQGKTISMSMFLDTSGGNVAAASAAARYTGYANAYYQSEGRSSGGAIYGPGTGTSDDAGLYRLSNGEHVLTADDVDDMGGQSAVYEFRRALQSGWKPEARDNTTWVPTYGSGSTGAAPQQVAVSFPETVTLVDENGSILSRARVVAEDVVSTHDAAATRRARGGRGL